MKRMSVAIAITILTISVGAHADKLTDKPEWQYANLLYEGEFTCRLKNDTYQAAVRYQSTKQDAARDDYMACIHEFSAKAQAGLPIAIKSAKNEQVKSRIKELYSSWDAYFGEFQGPGAGASKSKYENARAALKAELVSAQ